MSYKSLIDMSVVKDATGGTSDAMADLASKVSGMVDMDGVMSTIFGGGDGSLAEFFSVTGEASTPLGAVAASVGDVLYPVMVSFVALFAVTAMFQLLINALAFAFGSKADVANTLVNYVASIQNG